MLDIVDLLIDLYINMKNDKSSTNLNAKHQIEQCIHLLKEIFGTELLGVYLYGSSIVGGLQKFSDIDLCVVSNRATTLEEKSKLVTALLKISGIYMKSEKLPVELTVVVKSEINPWRYPPKFDFQYGDWLRQEFDSGNIEPWQTKEMPDLALLITQILLASHTLVGDHPNQLFPKVPYADFMRAIKESLPHLRSDLNGDTRNVLLTSARIWNTVTTDSICSKVAAADWAMKRLPDPYRPVLERAKAICKGKEKEHWEDIQKLIQPCADFMLNEIDIKLAERISSDNCNRSIRLAEEYREDLYL